MSHRSLHLYTRYVFSSEQRVTRPTATRRPADRVRALATLERLNVQR